MSEKPKEEEKQLQDCEAKRPGSQEPSRDYRDDGLEQLNTLHMTTLRGVPELFDRCSSLHCGTARFSAITGGANQKIRGG